MTLDPKDFKFSCHHGHSYKSFGDSILPTDRLVKGAKEMGYESVTLTDHGSLIEMCNYFPLAEKVGIKPIIGIESYFVNDDVKDSQKDSRHLVVLVQNETGWKNLLQLTYKSAIPVKDGGTFYFKPRFTDKEIFAHQEGLIFSSACLNGAISDYLIKGDETAARIEALKWKTNVENFYIELMPHKFEQQIIVNAQLAEIANDLDIPLLTTLDVHYEKPEQHESWMINGAIRRRQNVDTFENHMSPDMYYKTIDQIINDLKLSGLSERQIEESIRNSVKITNSIDFKWKNRMNEQPVYSPNIKAPEYLKQIAWQGLCKRFNGPQNVPQSYVERLKMEWQVISKMGFADYFLILHDMVSYAKQNGILVGPGRGSACGSMMLWALHVTEVDSLKYNLPFARFLNEERITSPDVDLDFEPIGRAKVIDYLKSKYGIDHVMQVSNHSELKAKAAIKDVARYFNYSFDQAQAITDLIPVKAENEDGEQITPTIKEVVELEEVKPYVNRHPELFEIAANLEGSYRQAGRHAGAVIITAKPVTEILPVMRAPGDDETFSLQAQWDKKQLETIGINKYDILGLSTLTSLRKCEEITGKKRSDIPDDDPKTWEYLRKAKNMEGIFQLSSPQMRGWCRKVIPEWKPGSEGLIDFLSDINAINRPAVLASGLGELYVRNLNSGKYDLQFDYDYIRMVLDLSNGVILYQEQVIYLAKEIAGMSFGKGDLLRRNLENMGTAGKRSEKVAKENEIYKKEFIKGAKQLHGYSDEICLGLWNWLCDSSGYGFCRAHSFSYSILGYQTAYFKANYPIEFYCVSINEALEKNSAKDNPVEKIVKEAQNNGIKLNLPSNGNSSSYCILNSGSITYGLNMIKGFSEKAAQLITEDKYTSFEQFCGMVLGTRSLNKKHVKSLIQIGYFSEFGTEAELWYKYQKLVWEFENLKKKMEWQGKKEVGRKVREFSDLKFEAEPLEGNKKQWLLELIGFNWENKLSEVVKDLEDKYFDTDKYIIGEVTNTKTGVSTYGTAWCLVLLKTEDGEKTAFLKDASYRLHKGDVIISKYLTKEGKNGKESTTLYDIIRY